MGVRDETLKMFRDGLSPKEITRRRGVSIKTTLGYLDEIIGRGAVRRSDIFFSIPNNIRNAIVEVVDAEQLPIPKYLKQVLKDKGIDADEEDIEVVIRYGDARHALGDMYEDIRSVELCLHKLIRSALEVEYGIFWWRKGVPLPIRKDCHSRREEDEELITEPYSYTELLDLWQIMDKQWSVLKRFLPAKLTADKQALRNKMIRLNTIRRNVMHPVRGAVPSEDDFVFIRELKRLLVT